MHSYRVRPPRLWWEGYVIKGYDCMGNEITLPIPLNIASNLWAPLQSLLVEMQFMLYDCVVKYAVVDKVSTAYPYLHYTLYPTEQNDSVQKVKAYHTKVEQWMKLVRGGQAQ